MAANGTQLNPGSGGDTIVTDPQSDGSRVEVATVGYGARGTDVQRVDPAHPLPVVDASVATLQAADHTDLAGLLSQLTSFTGADHTDLAAVLTALGPIATQTTMAAVLAKLNASLAVNLPASTATAFADAGTIAAGTYRGITIKNTSTTATAEVAIRNQNVTGTILDTITLAGNESVRETYPAGRAAASGTIYMQLVAGAVSGSVFAS